jgi:integrase
VRSLAALLFVALAVILDGRALALDAPARHVEPVNLDRAERIATMPAKATGSVQFKRGAWYARVTLAPGDRPWIALPTCATREAAEERKDILAPLAAKLRAAGVASDIARKFLEEASVREGRALARILEAGEALATGEARTKRAQSGPIGRTFEAVGKRWTSGELAAEYPDHVTAKSSADKDAGKLALYVYPVVGHVPLAAFTVDHAEAVMRGLPEGRARATRRHVAQVMHRVLSLAVFPLKMIPSNPLPRGFLPKLGPTRAKAWLYPDEDRRLLASPAVPLAWRLLYGFLNREGMRSSEATGLTWRSLDLDRGTVTLDVNKTDDPRAWALSPGVVRALAAWREHLRGVVSVEPDAPVFVDPSGGAIVDYRLAEQFRAHLRAAGVDRPELFERSAARRPIRLHDTRATFVTLALANGRSETWVGDRTGHKSSVMIAKYRRAARTAAELNLGDLAPLDAAIPELRASSGPEGGEASPRSVSAGGSEEPDPLPKTAVISGSSPGRTRTGTPLRAKDFKSPASTVPPRGLIGRTRGASSARSARSCQNC